MSWHASVEVYVTEIIWRSTEHPATEIPTFLLAGHETTSNGLTRTLWALSQHPDVQTHLREELRSFPLPADSRDSDPFSQEDIGAL